MDNKLFYTKDELLSYGSKTFWAAFVITSIGWTVALVGTVWYNGGKSCFILPF